MQITAGSQIDAESTTSNIPVSPGLNALPIDADTFSGIRNPTQEHLRVAKLRENVMK